MLDYFDKKGCGYLASCWTNHRTGVKESSLVWTLLPHCSHFCLAMLTTRSSHTSLEENEEHSRDLYVEWGSTNTGWHINVHYVNFFLNTQKYKVKHNRDMGMERLQLKWVRHLWLKWVGHLWLNGWESYGSNGWGSHGKMGYCFGDVRSKDKSKYPFQSP